jgi:excinuclease UvrABC nuclease subunit
MSRQEKQKVLQNLEMEMLHAAEMLNFERAAYLRDLIKKGGASLRRRAR